MIIFFNNDTHYQLLKRWLFTLLDCSLGGG